MQLSTFQFSQNCTIRAFEKNGISWFVAADVCKALEIQNPTQALEKLDDDERAMFNIGLENQGLFDSRIKEVNIINESGLYILILRSRNAMKQGTIQHKFRKWVTSEVLPAIRKTGSYQKQPETPTKSQNYFELLAKMTNYAKLAEYYQRLLCNNPNSKEAKKLLNQFMYSTNVNQTGFLFIFKPDIENDIQQAYDWLHNQSQHI